MRYIAATRWILDAVAACRILPSCKETPNGKEGDSDSGCYRNQQGSADDPKAIRDKFKLKTGDRIEFLEESGKIVMIPASVDLVALGSVLPPPRRHVSIEQMNRAIEAHAVRRFRRK